jgi:hypothetical protein
MTCDSGGTSSAPNTRSRNSANASCRLEAVTPQPRLMAVGFGNGSNLNQNWRRLLTGLTLLFRLEADNRTDIGISNRPKREQTTKHAAANRKTLRFAIVEHSHFGFSDRAVKPARSLGRGAIIHAFVCSGEIDHPVQRSLAWDRSSPQAVIPRMLTRFEQPLLHSPSLSGSDRADASSGRSESKRPSRPPLSWNRYGMKMAVEWTHVALPNLIGREKLQPSPHRLRGNDATESRGTS